MTLTDDLYRLLHPREFRDLGVDELLPNAPGDTNFDVQIIGAESPARQRISPTDENNLVVIVFSAFDAVLTLSGTGRQKDGELTPLGPNGAGFAVRVVGDRQARSFVFSVGSGVVVQALTLVATSAPVAIPVNGCWAVVQTSRLLSDETLAIMSTIMSGPVTLVQPLAYPGSVIQKTGDSTGYHRIVQPANPAAGANMNIAVPTNARWQVNTFIFALDTLGPATGLTRETEIGYLRGGVATEFNLCAQGSFQGDGLSFAYAFGATLPPIVSNINGVGSVRQTGIPGNRFLSGKDNETIVSFTLNLAPTDQYRNQVLGVIEVLDP